MGDKNRKDAALDSTGSKGVIEYTDEQVEEHEKREKRAAQINKKVEKVAEEEGHVTPTPQDVEKATPHTKRSR